MIKLYQLIQKAKSVISNNIALVGNILGAFLIKGFGMIVSLLIMPLYIDFFEDKTVLGLWFTILSVLNWILSCDVGIGNGLRNHLTKAISLNDMKLSKELVSSAYFILGILAFAFIITVYIIIPYVDWNGLFNIGIHDIDRTTLVACVKINIIGILISFFLRIISSIIYALQMSSVNNFLNLLTNVFIALFLYYSNSSDVLEVKLIKISWAYAIIINIPLVLATIYIFLISKLKDCKPNLFFITKRAMINVLSLGVTFFAVQILSMILYVTNEWFISKFFAPSYCVDYQIYNRAFTLLSGLFVLALTPLWSAITKAYTERRYEWIVKLYRLLSMLAMAFLVLELLVLPFMQLLLNFWLKENTIQVNYFTALIFVFYSVIYIWVSILGTLVSGIGKLSISLYLNLFAVLFKVCGIVIVAQYIDKWEIVILVTAISLIPYCIIQTYYVKRLLAESKVTP